MDSDTSPRNKRNYIRRKKYLQDCANKLKSTVQFIHNYKNENVSESEIEKECLEYAQGIEAMCWSPHCKLNSTEYQGLMTFKMQELCQVLIKQTFPSSEFNKILAMVTSYTNKAKHTQMTPQPQIKPKKEPKIKPLPILVAPENMMISDDDEEEKYLYPDPSFAHYLYDDPFRELDREALEPQISAMDTYFN